MKQEILTKLRSAEEDYARRLEAAKERAADVVKKARLRVEEIRRQAEEDARRDQEQQLAAERQRLAQERERLLAEGRSKEERLRTRYKSTAETHVKKAIEAFARSVNA